MNITDDIVNCQHKINRKLKQLYCVNKIPFFRKYIVSYMTNLIKNDINKLERLVDEQQSISYIRYGIDVSDNIFNTKQLTKFYKDMIIEYTDRMNIILGKSIVVLTFENDSDSSNDNNSFENKSNNFDEIYFNDKNIESDEITIFCDGFQEPFEDYLQKC